MKFCQCYKIVHPNNTEHYEYNDECPYNNKMDFVIFTKAISENFSLDGKQRWTDSQIINFMIEDDKCNDMIMDLIAKNFRHFASFTIEDIIDWEERVIYKGD